MKNKQRKSGEAKDEVLKSIPMACINEMAAVEFIENQRWGSQPACPHCGSIDVHKMTDGNGNRNKRFLWRCNDCHKQYTVRIGTIFEDSRIPLRIWCHAFWRACSSKKGVSALQISRECNITYKSALFLMHRIRYSMSTPNSGEKLNGVVEADETYVGGKPRYSQKRIAGGPKLQTGRGTKKTPVMGLVERNGNVRMRVLPNITGKTLRGVLQQDVNLAARIVTDEFPVYKGICKDFSGGHGVVNHGHKEYVRGDDTTNTVESLFSLLKRGIYGTFHAVSKKHLHRYVDEFAFRWNTRKVNDGACISKAIKSAEGKRLMYREPISRTA